jgi:protein-L-isoaspartate O-methyltransferase
MRELLLNDCRVSIQDGRRILEINTGEGYTTL